MYFIIYYIIILFFWGLNPVFYRVLLDNNINYISILLCTSFLYFITLLIFILISKKHQNYIKNDIIKFNNKKLILGAIIMGIGGFLAQYSYLYVIKYDKLHISAVLSACYPIVTVLLAYLYYNEIISFYRLSGIILVISGIFVINISK